MKKIQSGITVIQYVKDKPYAAARGDVFLCKECNNEVISDLSVFTNDPEYVKREIRNPNNILWRVDDD